MCFGKRDEFFSNGFGSGEWVGGSQVNIFASDFQETGALRGRER
jgi:hypothetical protein